MVSAAFVRLSQEAATSRSYRRHGAGARSTSRASKRSTPARPARCDRKMGIEERVPEFVDEALRARQAAAGLTSVLKMMPQTTMEQLAAKFNRCSLREDAEHVANLAADLGEEGVQYLRSTVRGGPIAEAVEMVGLLCKLDPQAVLGVLAGAHEGFSSNFAGPCRSRQISASGAPGRCRDSCWSCSIISIRWSCRWRSTRSASLKTARRWAAC